MKIPQNHTTPYTNPYRPNFGAYKICSGNVIQHFTDGTKKLLPVDICLIRSEDKPLMTRLNKTWRGYAKTISYRFINTHRKASDGKEGGFNYFIVIPKEPLPPRKKTLKEKLLSIFKKQPQHDTPDPLEPLCMAEIERYGKVFEPTYLQSAPRVLELQATSSEKSKKGFSFFSFSKEKELEKISGAGTMLMYALSRISRTMKSSLFRFESSNDSFYQKIFHCQKYNETDFIIDEKTLITFIQETQEKYGLQKSKPELPEKVIDEINRNTYLI